MFLCHDRIFPRHNRDWPRKEILCCDRACVVATERAVGHMFLCHDRIFPRHNRDWPRKEILCCDRACVVATERVVG